MHIDIRDPAALVNLRRDRSREGGLDGFEDFDGAKTQLGQTFRAKAHRHAGSAGGDLTWAFLPPGMDWSTRAISRALSSIISKSSP